MSASVTSAAVALLLGGSLLSAAAVAAVDEVSRFRDPEIIESSGLIARDDSFITTNDSGDSGRLFVVDQASGETMRVVSWTDEPEDVEALAPADGSAVWVGDIGDNGADRDEVEVAWVDLAEDAETRTYEVKYREGSADAEALLRHPKNGQLFIATKSVFGGELLALPTQLRERKNNEAASLGNIAGLVTDGAFFPDGQHFILRNYSDAFVYAYPTLDLVGEFELPDQEQGEGLAIADAQSVYLSSEGVEAPILLVQLPADIRVAMQLAPATEGPNDEEPQEPQQSPPGSPEDLASANSSSDAGQGMGPSWWWLLLAGFAGTTVTSALWRRRNRGR